MNASAAHTAASSVTRGQLEVTVVGHDVGPVGGMPRQLSELVLGLLAQGHVVTVVSRTCELDPHPRLRWVRVRGPARPFLVAYPWFFLAGSWLVWRHGRGVVHTTGAIVGSRAAVSTVHFCHRAVQERGGLLRASRNTLLYRLNARVAGLLSLAGERLVYRPGRVGFLAAVSNGLAEELRRFFPMPAERIVTVRNGVDTGRFRPDPERRAHVRRSLGISAEARVLLFVGGEWTQKGLGVAIEAIARAPDWQLVVVGSGDLARYGNEANRAGVARRVHFVRRTERPEDYFAAADAFVLPSAYESFSLVAYEAAAAGLPVLATRVHGIDDLVVDGENGWFVERDPETVARRLRTLAANPDLRQRLASAARAAVLETGWDRMVSSYIELYRRSQAELTELAVGPETAGVS